MRRFVEGTELEGVAGYCRAVRCDHLGSVVAVSGTTADADPGQPLPIGTFAQTEAAFRRALRGAEALGASTEHVVRTRVYLTPEADWREASAAHALLFGDNPPANTTLYVHALIGDGLLVEVELDAVVSPDQ